MDMAERLHFKQTADLTPRQIAEGVTAYEATAAGVTYRIEGSVIAPLLSGRREYAAYRVIRGQAGRLHHAGSGGWHRTRAKAVQQCEADLDNVLRDRAAAETDPATTDDAQELMDRVIRRAQYLALQAVLAELDTAHAASGMTGPLWSTNGVRNFVNDAARALGTAEPYRPTP